jgi:hypothetical protein
MRRCPDTMKAKSTEIAAQFAERVCGGMNLESLEEGGALIEDRRTPKDFKLMLPGGVDLAPILGSDGYFEQAPFRDGFVGQKGEFVPQLHSRQRGDLQFYRQMAGNQDSELAKALGIDSMGDQAAMNRQNLEGYEDAASPGAPAGPATSNEPLLSEEPLREQTSLEDPIDPDPVEVVATVEGDIDSA